MKSFSGEEEQLSSLLSLSLSGSLGCDLSAKCGGKIVYTWEAHCVACPDRRFETVEPTIKCTIGRVRSQVKVAHAAVQRTGRVLPGTAFCTVAVSFAPQRGVFCTTGDGLAVVRVASERVLPLRGNNGYEVFKVQGRPLQVPLGLPTTTCTTSPFFLLFPGGTENFLVPGGSTGGDTAYDTSP